MKKPLFLLGEFWTLLFLTLAVLGVTLILVGLTDTAYGTLKPTHTPWKPPVFVTRTVTESATAGWWGELPTPIPMPTWWATRTPTPTHTPTRTPWGWKSPTSTP